MVYTPVMADLAVMLNLEGRRCVVVGGGKTGLRRARTLVDCGAEVHVVGRDLDEGFTRLAVTTACRDYQAGDVDHARLVVAATDDEQVNRRVAEDARRVGALVNRVDDPSDSDLLFPAQARRGPITLAVHTQGISANAAARIRDQLLHDLDPVWPRLLEIAGPYRAQIQAKVTDGEQRQAALRRLTDDEALGMLKEEGEASLRCHFERLVG